MSAAAEILRMPESSKAEFVSNAESAPVAAVLCDDEGNITATNPAAEQMLPARNGGRAPIRLTDLIQVQDRLQVERLMLAVAASEQEAFQLDTRVPGSGRAIRWTVRKLAAPTRVSTGMLALGEPVARETDGRQELRQAQRLELVGRLASGVAHDLNNLLTGVLLYSDLLMTTLEPGHNARKYAEEIRKVGLQASGVVKQFLTLAKPSAGPLRLLSLNEIAGGMKDLLTRLMGAQIDLRFHLDPNLGLVRMDSTQVQQILLNLVLNARDAMPHGGLVEIKTGNCKVQILPEAKNGENDPSTLSCALFVVSDNGHGMDEATRSRLFEPFFTTKGGKGTGLGLTTVHDIVTSSGGLIYVDSAPMKGTRVSVLLPLADEETSDFSAIQHSSLPGSEEKTFISNKGIMP